MNLSDARTIFEREVLESKPECTIVESATREYPSCFVFCYQSIRFVETGNFDEMLVGHGSVLVSKSDGNAFETGSAYSIERYVEAFESCGDPYGEMTAFIVVYGWQEGANKVAATKLIKARAGLNLRDSKVIIDKALKLEESRFSTENVETSSIVNEELTKLGFKSKQLWSNRC